MPSISGGAAFGTTTGNGPKADVKLILVKGSANDPKRTFLSWFHKTLEAMIYLARRNDASRSITSTS